MFDSLTTPQLQHVYDTMVNYTPRRFAYGTMELYGGSPHVLRCLVGAYRYTLTGSAIDVATVAEYPLNPHQEIELWAVNDHRFGHENPAERYQRVLDTLHNELAWRAQENRSDLPVPDFALEPVAG